MIHSTPTFVTMAPRRTSYTHEFKIRAVNFAIKIKNNRKAAEELGCNEANIRRWKKDIEKIKAEPRQNHSIGKRKAKWPEMEVLVKDFVIQKRLKGLCVSRGLIRLEALKQAKKLNINGFSASEGWCTRFMKRHGFVIRCPTKIAKILGFQRYVIRKRSQEDYPLSAIGNMDETPVYMDMVPGASSTRGA